MRISLGAGSDGLVGGALGFAAHGIGVGRVHDRRFVEPAVKDRVDVLDLIDHILAS
jgi:hypothetical protein